MSEYSLDGICPARYLVIVKKWGDARSYDFCLDSSVLGIDKTVDMIIEYLKIRYPEDKNIK